MSRTLLASLMLAACLISPWPAAAQSGYGGIVATVDKLDRNFDAADRNRDGLLSKEEAAAGHVSFVVSHFDAIDTKHRGQVSKDDMHDFIKRLLLRSQPAPGSSARQN